MSAPSLPDRCSRELAPPVVVATPDDASPERRPKGERRSERESLMPKVSGCRMVEWVRGSNGLGGRHRRGIDSLSTRNCGRGDCPCVGLPLGSERHGHPSSSPPLLLSCRVWSAAPEPSVPTQLGTGWRAAVLPRGHYIYIYCTCGPSRASTEAAELESRRPSGEHEQRLSRLLLPSLPPSPPPPPPPLAPPPPPPPPPPPLAPPASAELRRANGEAKAKSVGTASALQLVPASCSVGSTAASGGLW